MFITSLLFLQTANKLRLGEDMVRFINRTVDALTLFLIAMYFLNTSQMYVMNGKLTTYLTFGFTNPNLTGLFLVCLYMLETYRLFTKENVWRKLAHVIMAVALAWFVIASRSRNCLLALLMYTAICAWLIFKGHDKMRITKAVALGIAVLPALFVLVYVTLVHSEWVMDAFSFLVDEGKLLDSRTRIWLQALEQIKQSPIIGAYSQISNGTGTGHMHNSHLDMASSYGIPVLCMTIVLLYRYLYQRGRSYTDKKGYTYIWGFACAVMLGIGEAALVSGGMGIYVFMGTFLLLTPNTDAGVAP